MTNNPAIKYFKRIAFLLCCMIAVSRVQAQNAYLRHFNTANGLPSNNCFYTLQDSQGYIWIATDAGVSRFDGKIFENFSIDDGLPDNQIIQLKEDRQGRIWFLTLNGQLSYFFNGRIYNEANNGSLKPLNSNALIVSFFQDSKGRIWLGTSKNMLVMWDGRKVIKYTSANAAHPFINTFVHEDATGKIWAFSNKCVRLFNGHNFITVSHNSLPLSYKTALNLPDRSMAYLDYTGLRIRSGNRDFLQKKIPEAVLKHNPGFFYLDADTDLWISTANGIFHSGIQNQINTYLSKFSTNHVIKDGKGNMWFSTTNGIYMLPKKNERIYLINKSNGLSSDVITSIIGDKNDKIWLSLADGNIFHMNPENHEIDQMPLSDNGRPLRYPEVTRAPQLYTQYVNSKLLKKRINDSKILADSSMVMATDGYGLLFLKNRKVIRSITQKEGLSDNICKKLFMKGKHLWITTNNGINRIDLSQSKIHVESFEYTDALLAHDVNDLFVDERYAYFATNNGLVYFTYQNSIPRNAAPKVLISSISNDKRMLDMRQKSHILAPSSDNITFTYSAIDFQNRKISYRYRLKSDATWIETRNRRLEFSALSPGRYIFEVAAKSQNSGWSSAARVNFTLKKHFWQSTWFLVSFSALIAFVCYKFAVIVTRRQKDKEQDKLRLKNKILTLEQRALQAMMNPHFVFNVMNSIQHYINTSNTSAADKILTGFARLIRKNLDMCTKSYITLAEELEYIELYLSLEKKRFGDKLQYRIQIDPAIDKEETFIPSMILQPYLENAIWHGVMPRALGGSIELRIEEQGEHHILIKITDDGVGIDNSLRAKTEHAPSKGLNLTRERINLLNQIAANPIQLEIKQTGISGTYVAITIPI